MARKKQSDNKRPIESYEHRDKERVNNPPVGLVTPETDPDTGKKKTYAYDPHLDPQLVWAGKAEHTSFEVPTVSLHVHERIDPRTILEAVRKRNGGGQPVQLPLFEVERKEPLRSAIEFYQHRHGWTNRLIAGDSLLVMNSLLEKEGMAGKVQMIYIDPPYGIKYGSNFQPFVNKRDVKDGRDEDLTSEPEQIKAFRDTWELGIHSYLTYLRDRLLLARELLTESGSIFVQISDENVHHVRELMDEVFGAGNFVAVVTYKTTGGARQEKAPKRTFDFLLWYCKRRDEMKFRRLFVSQDPDVGIFTEVEEQTGHRRPLKASEKSNVERILQNGLRLVTTLPLHSKSPGDREPREFQGRMWSIPTGSWRYSYEGFERLGRAGRLLPMKSVLRTLSYFQDWAYEEMTAVWGDTGPELSKIYAVQTNPKVIQRCLLMTTDPGDLVFDPTCVRKGTRVFAPLNPPINGGTSTPSPMSGRAGEGHPSPMSGKDGVELLPIEAIQPGNFVLGHDGKPHRVLRTIRKLYRGTMVGIRHNRSAQTLWVTADHYVLCQKRTLSYGAKRTWHHVPGAHFERAQELRREMTPAERQLWSALRGEQLGVKFRRQHPIGPYIADFYSWEAGLVVEVDGSSHFTPEAQEHDRKRDAYLSSLGLTVLRFTNQEVTSQREGVLHKILDTIAAVKPSEDHYKQWRRADTLQVGDVVYFGPEQQPVEITELLHKETQEEVYDLEVEEAHSFLTEVCAVHNCGSGTTAYVAEQWGRRWITCDTSRVAITLARQRLMTAVFDYYELAHPKEGVGSGFKYKTVPHVTLKSIANNPEIDGIYSRMHPAIETALAELNAALKTLTPSPSPKGRGEQNPLPPGEGGRRPGEGYPRFKVERGGRAGHFVDFSAPDSATFTMPSGQVVKVNELVEWEVPFAFPADWPEAARTPFERFHEARRAMQKAMDEAIARHADQETLYDQPSVDRRKVRVTGPFTVEAVPAPAVKSVEEILEPKPEPADLSIARSGETLRQAEWRDELLRTGIRGKAGQVIRFSRLEPLPGCRYLHADGETRPSAEGTDRVRDAPAYNPMRVVVSFGPEHGPLEQRQVEHAWEEARTLEPKPKLLVFAAFQFDPEAAKDIDEMKPELAGMQFLKVQMNADLLTDDLKKKRASNESFWLIGQPDVEVVSEQWIVNSRKDALAPYDVVAKLSGLDRLAEINGLSRDDLSHFLAIAQRRDLWDAAATDTSSSVHSRQHSGGTGTSRDRGVPSLPGHSTRLPRRIGDAADFVRAIESVGGDERAKRIERLRGNREIAERARQIAASLTSTHYPLTTVHYYQVTVHGFDYYNTKTGQIESGGSDKIALWMLDTDYDGRSLYPRQVFFPMAGENEGWAKLARNLKAEIDEERIESYRGTVSLPFEPGEHKRLAVKIVDDRGIESLKVVNLDEVA